jgi:hypothetical protein
MLPAQGEIVVPEGWDASIQITLKEPESNRLSAPLAKKRSSGPRANITVRRFASSVDLDGATARFLAEAKGAPRFRPDPIQTVRFDDGADGRSIVIHLEATPGLEVAQRHVFRIDHGVVTQIAATVEVGRASELEEGFAAIMLSFRLSR